MGDVAMPRLSDSMEEGTIVRWLKSDGDEVKRGEELAEIETDKATMTYEADQDGTLEIVAQEGDTLAIGEVIARIGAGGGGEDEASSEDEDEDEDAADEEEGSEDEDREAEPEEDESEADDGDAEPDENEATPDKGSDGGNGSEADADGHGRRGSAREPVSTGGLGDGSGAGERLKASPVARRIARDLGVELEALSGTGPGGRIVKADVEQAAQANGHAETAEDEAQEAGEAAADAPGDGASGRGDTAVEELSRTQQLIARRMAESKATIPDFTLQTEVDMEAAVAARAQLKQLAGDQPAPSYNDMIVKACALALREHPRANGSYRDGQFELHRRVNVGVAVATEDALVVPTVFDADTKPLGRIARDTRELAGRVREGKISPPELSGGTFTVSNLGMFGISSFTAVINPPQAAILAVGAVEPRAVVREDELVARHTMSMTLVCDHRILYGAPAAGFLARVRELLENPAGLAL